MKPEKIDLLAYLEQRLSAADKAEADAMLEQSPQLRDALQGLRRSFELVGRAADQARGACPDDGALGYMADQALGAIDEEPLPPLPELVLELPDDLKKAVAVRHRSNLAGRVAKSLGVVGRMGADKARDLADKLTNLVPEPGAAMAIRGDATDVDNQASDQENGQNGDNGQKDN